MARTTEEIAGALMNALYGLVDRSLGGLEDDTEHDPFVCWCKPGIPFEPEDFRFAKFMLRGQGATDEERAADAALQLTQAAGFSRFVDFVPSVDGVVGGKMDGGVLRPSSATLSGFYKRVLDSSQVAQLPEPAGLNEKIQQLRDQLKPMKDAYDECAGIYEKARSALLSAQLHASWSATAALEFQATGAELIEKAHRASQNWEIEGFRTQYDNLIAEIESLRTKRSPAIWRSEALRNYDLSTQGRNATFGEARPTMPYPPNFATSNSGWTKLELSTEHIDKLSNKKSSKWAASGGFRWSSLKLGGSAEGSTTQSLAISNTNSFSLKLWVAQVPLLRQTWFDPWFLRSEFWRFKPESMDGTEKNLVTDGGNPPAGLIVAWPSHAIFVRDVEIGLDELRDESSELVKTLKAEGKGGWGLGALNIGGSYERNSEVKTQKVDHDKGTLTVAGLQCVGFLCEVTGKKAPDPKPGLTWIAAG